jgi:hypothetical protein
VLTVIFYQFILETKNIVRVHFFVLYSTFAKKGGDITLDLDRGWADIRSIICLNCPIILE